MNELDTPDASWLGMGPEELDGHTIEELSDYVDAARTPANPSIDESPGCRIALDALERLRALSPELLALDAEAEPTVDESWVQGILTSLTVDARAGRRIPLTAPTPELDLGITEGAVRGVIRAAESDVSGVVVGRCRFDGDITIPSEPVRVSVEVSVPYTEPIPDLSERLRQGISTRLALHTTLNVTAIDISVRDIQPPNPTEKE